MDTSTLKKKTIYLFLILLASILLSYTIYHTTGSFEFKLTFFGFKLFDVDTRFLVLSILALFLASIFFDFSLSPLHIQGSIEFIFSTIFSKVTFKPLENEGLKKDEELKGNEELKEDELRDHVEDELAFDYRLIEELNVIQHFILMEAFEEPLFKDISVKTTKKKIEKLDSKSLSEVTKEQKENLLTKILSKIVYFTQYEDFIFRMLIEEKKSEKTNSSREARTKLNVEAFKGFIIEACNDAKDYLNHEKGIEIDVLIRPFQPKKEILVDMKKYFKENNIFKNLCEVNVFKNFDKDKILKFFAIMGEDASHLLVIGHIEKIAPKVYKKLINKLCKIDKQRSLSEDYSELKGFLMDKLQKEFDNIEDLLNRNDDAKIPLIEEIDKGIDKFFGVHFDPVSAILRDVIRNKIINNFKFNHRKIIEIPEESPRVWVPEKTERLDKEPTWFDIVCKGGETNGFPHIKTILFHFTLYWSFIDVKREAFARFLEGIYKNLGDKPWATMTKPLLEKGLRTLDFKRERQTNKKFKMIILDLLKRNVAIKHLDFNEKGIKNKVSLFDQENYPKDWEDTLKILTPSLRKEWK